MTSHLPQRGF